MKNQSKIQTISFPEPTSSMLGVGFNESFENAYLKEFVMNRKIKVAE